MAKQIRMRSKTTFENTRITIFPKDGPAEGVPGTRAVTTDEEFGTDEYHARELKAAGFAEPLNASDLDGDPTEPLEAHYTVSEPQLRASRAKFEKDKPAPAAISGAPAAPARAAPVAPAAKA